MTPRHLWTLACRADPHLPERVQMAVGIALEVLADVASHGRRLDDQAADLADIKARLDHLERR